MTIFMKGKFAPPMQGAHFIWIWLVSRVGSSPRVDHARKMSCLRCDLSEILELARPPDPDLVDLIEQAFLARQIDGQKADLAFYWLEANKD
jgi:hypothetical protein